MSGHMEHPPVVSTTVPLAPQAQSRTKRSRVLRPLNQNELSAVYNALERMARSNARDALVARAMIDEQMPGQLWWMDGEL